MTKIGLSNLNVSRKVEYDFLKPKQFQSVSSILSGNDTLSILPTGYGKSLIFELIPYVLRVKHSMDHCMIIACPLNAIIKQQLMWYKGNSIEITSNFFNDKENNDIQGVLEGKYMYVHT